jgi:hypothetical protein
MSAREGTIDRRRLLWSPDGRSLPKSNTICFPRRPRRTALAAVGTWVRYIYMNHPNATKPPESLPRMKGVARENRIRQVKTTSMKKASKPHPVLIQSVK